MQRRNSRLSTFVVFVLLVTMIAMILVSGTYAKYVSEAEISDKAVVAKWSVKLNDTDIASTSKQTLTIDLFDTVLDTSTAEQETNISNSTETIIAPGTYGCLALEVENLSDVTAKIEASFGIENNSNIPLLYAVGDSATAAVDSLSWGTDVRVLNFNDELAYTDGSSEVYIYWMWEFEGNKIATQTDTTDTSLGMLGSSASVTLTVDITATQVD